MNKDLNIMIVDDHPMTVNGYINVLSDEDFEGYSLNFKKALNCEEAYKIITEQDKLDFVYLDLSLPPYPEKNIFSGLDLGVLLRNHCPECIIVFLTMHSEAELVQKLITQVDPQGILCKSDIDIDEFLNAFKIILSGQTYFSTKIIKSLNDRVFDGYRLDTYDKQILMRLSEGIPTNSIPSYVPLSLPDIEKRTVHLKALLLSGDENGNDADLVAAIKKMGIL